MTRSTSERPRFPTQGPTLGLGGLNAAALATALLVAAPSPLEASPLPASFPKAAPLVDPSPRSVPPDAQLAPTLDLAASHLKRAGRQLEAGRAGASLRTLLSLRESLAAAQPEATGPRLRNLSLQARYLEARVQLRMGLRDDATSELEALLREPEFPPGLRSLTQFRLGELQALRQEPVLAMQLFEEVPLGSTHWFEARQSEIQLALRRGALEEACALAAELAGELRYDPRESRAWWSLGRCLERQGRRLRHKDPETAKRRLAEARGLYQGIAALWPRHAIALLASERVKQLNHPNGQRPRAGQRLPPWQLEPSEIVERAQRVGAKTHPRYARWILRRLQALLPTRERGARATLGLMLGDNAFKLRRFRRSYRWYRRVERSKPGREQLARARLGIGRLQARVGSRAAYETYMDIARRFPETRAGREALQRAAEAARRLGAVQASTVALTRCVAAAEQAKALELGLGCRLRLARMKAKRGQLDEALTLTEQAELLAEGEGPERGTAKLESIDSGESAVPSPSSPSLLANWYWRGRWLDRLGKPEQAAVNWRRVARATPLQLYGILSRRLLFDRGEALEDDDSLLAATDPHPAVTLAPAVAEAQDLEALGLRREASRALGSVSRESLDARSREVGAALLLGWGRLPSGHRMAPLPWTGGLGERRPVSKRAARLAYPKAYAELIESKQRDPRVAPELLRALIRVESGFDPRAHSPARARGLTQLLWRTARRVAQQHKLRLRRAWQLYDPKVSVQLGSTYLGDLIDHFDGRLVLAIAAYNAGEVAVGRWAKRHAGQTVDELVEEIPFEETRRYVGRVLSFYAMYWLLEGRSVGELPIDLQQVLASQTLFGADSAALVALKSSQGETPN